MRWMELQSFVFMEGHHQRKSEKRGGESTGGRAGDRPGSRNPISSCGSSRAYVSPASASFPSGASTSPYWLFSSLSISLLKEVRQGSQGFAGHMEERMIHAGKVPPPPVTQV